MVDPEDASYVCTLTPESLEKAKRELFEDPKQRLGAVQTLRKWIKDQPHLTCRTGKSYDIKDKTQLTVRNHTQFFAVVQDTDFMLAVLRTAKFSQLRAREIIETMLTMKTKLSHLLNNVDSHDPVILTALERGIVVPLPKTDRQGRAIMITRPGCLDLNDSRFTVAYELKLGFILGVLLKERNENVVVNGEIIIFDMTGFSTKHVSRMTMEKNNKEHFKFMQECNVGRMKGFHFYNAGPFFEIVMSIIKPFMKKKYLDRMHIHNTMESLYEEIPMDLWPDEYLPDDYTGPSAGPIKTIVGDLRQRLLDPSFRARLIEYTSEKYKIDASKQPSDAKQQQASFRKLTDD